MTMNEQILRQEILARSVATDWESAKKEWQLERVEFCSMRDAEACLCTHFPIMELCFLRNERNGQNAMVGNVCVQKFLGIPSAVIFRGFKRIMADPAKAASLDVIKYAFKQRWISDWERTFCEDTVRKRRLSNVQLSKRIEINLRLADRVREVQADVDTRLNGIRGGSV